MPRPPRMTLLARPGPARSAAVQAIASTLNRDLRVCRDRGTVVAARALDAAVQAALDASRPTPGDP